METVIEHKETESVVKFIFPTEDLPDMIMSLCIAGGYQSTIMDDEGNEVANSVTPKQFAWERIRDYALGELNHYRKNVKVAENTKDITIPEVEVKGL